jgi:cell division protein FtsQ
VPGVPCIDGISCDKVVLYEKLPIKQTMLKDILELTQGLKRQDLVPDSVDYGAQNAPVVKYGNVSVIIGDTTKLTRKIERLKAIMPSLEGQSGTLHLESWTEETTNIVFDKSE